MMWHCGVDGVDCARHVGYRQKEDQCRQKRKAQSNNRAAVRVYGVRIADYAYVRNVAQNDEQWNTSKSRRANVNHCLALVQQAAGLP
jgi:hypothetical protein